MPGIQELLLKVIVTLTALIVTLLPSYQGEPGGTDNDTITTVPIEEPAQPAPTAIAPTTPVTPTPAPTPIQPECPTTPPQQPTPVPLPSPVEPEEDSEEGDVGEGDAGDEGGAAADEEGTDEQGAEEEGGDAEAGNGGEEAVDQGGETAAPAPTTAVPTTAPTCIPTTPAPPNTSPVDDPNAPPTTPNDPTAPAPPAPGAPNPGQTVPVGNTPVFTGDYDTGDFSQWSNCQSAEGNEGCGPSNSRMEIVNDGPGHETAAHFTVQEGDQVASGQRSEVRASDAADVSEGDERWYEFSLKVTPDFAEPTGWGLILMQWHPGGGSPVLTLSAEGGNLAIGGHERESHVIGPLPKGEWKDYVLHVKFSGDESSGFVEAWENGVQTVQQTPYAALAGGDAHYLKQGIYRGDMSGTHEAWHDGLRITAP